MPLPVGTRLGPYEILGLLGVGGMGEVYRAADTRLGRQVAVKILPAEVAGDPDRLRRFEVESRAASALNHPAILVVFDVGTEGATPFVVTELLEGRTLREELDSGPLPVPKAVERAVQAAHGLAAAHAKQIVHRDLKPTNLFVTRDGRLKILDFGLAKVISPRAAGDPEEASTLSGTVIGTVGYMSPEQARGTRADPRSDIFALGATLYEMLSGRRAFQGDTAAEVQAAVLKEEPPPLSTVNPQVPASLERLVGHCLAKDPEARLQSARDLALALEGLSDTRPSAGLRQASPWTRHRLALGVLGGVLLGWLASGILGWQTPRPTAQPRATRRLLLDVLDAAPLDLASWIPFALSPDGRLFVHTRSRPSASGRSSTASASGGASQLWLRRLDEAVSRPLAGTEGGHEPFFSPDGKWVGFWADGKLRKVSHQGGTAVTLCEAPDLWGASWGEDRTIVFAPGQGRGLQRVSDGGGSPEAASTLGSGETAHLWPQVLPGGKAMLLTIRSAGGDRIGVQPLPGGERKVLIEEGGMARFVPTGHIVYARGGTLYGVPFDPRRLALGGPSAALPDPVYVGQEGNALFSVSAEGSLALVGPRGRNQSLVWADSTGPGRPILRDRTFSWPRVSPDGRHILFKENEGTGDLWAYDAARDDIRRVTLDGVVSQPAWTPRGDVAYAVRTGTGYSLVAQPWDGSRPTESLLAFERRVWPGSWSPDGRSQLVSVLAANGGGDIARVESGATTTLTPFIAGPANEWGPSISPDGSSVAYVSDESGRFEVYVRPLVGGGTRRQVSVEGGTEPVWSRDGRLLYYRNGDALLSVAATRNAPGATGRPQVVFRGPYVGSVPGLPNYDVAPDGRILMVLPADPGSEPQAIQIVVDWFEELRRRVPATP